MYCGPFGTADCHACYLRAIADREAAGRWHAGAARPEAQAGASDLTINELPVAYRRFAASYHVKDGRSTTEQRAIQLSLRPQCDIYGHELVAEVKPAQLRVIRQAFIDAGLCRNEVNKRTRRLTRLFGWGGEEGLVPAPVHWAPKAAKGIRRGRGGVQESEPVLPVPDDAVDAILPYLSPQVRAMDQLQRLTGMRPREVCRMRTIDDETSGPVMS